MDALTHLTFTVRLKRLHLDTEGSSQSSQTRVDFVQRDGAVVNGVPLAEHVVIDAVKHEDFHEIPSL
jgi:hypothetical protein